MTIPQWLDRKEYPFQSNFFLFEGVRQHYIDEGQGETLLFVHGTPSWSFDFRKVISALSPTCRCIALDHIGFGLSDKPADYNYATQQHAERLIAFITHLKLTNIHLIVHDFGGPIAFRYALQHPENIKSLTILNSWLWSSEGDPDFKRLKPILKNPLLPFLYKYLNFSARFIMPAAFGEKPLSKSMAKQYSLPFPNAKSRLGTLAFAQSLLKDQDWFEWQWQQIHKLKHIPTLFIWGMKDPVIKPQNLDKFRSGFNNATIVRLETCGHFPQEEEAEAVSHAIQNFMQQLVIN